VPFAVSFLIYPLKLVGSPLFESIMPLVISLTTITLAFFYLKDLKTGFKREGVMIGLAWIIISLALDLVLILPPSPMQMSLTDYMADIGLTYLMILFIAMGMGYMAAEFKK
jgi:hypothetical protein